MKELIYLNALWKRSKKKKKPKEQTKQNLVILDLSIYNYEHFIY